MKETKQDKEDLKKTQKTWQKQGGGNDRVELKVSDKQQESLT